MTGKEKWVNVYKREEKCYRERGKEQSVKNERVKRVR
jgi:hypothetical protein